MPGVPPLGLNIDRCIIIIIIINDVITIILKRKKQEKKKRKRKGRKESQRIEWKGKGKPSEGYNNPGK